MEERLLRRLENIRREQTARNYRKYSQDYVRLLVKEARILGALAILKGEEI